MVELSAEHMPSAFQWLTFAIAAIGAGLGILNTWNAFDLRRVKLKVDLSAMHNVYGQTGWTIGVVNHSGCAVTLSEIGFILGNRVNGDYERLVADPATYEAGSTPPIRLEAKSRTYATIPLSDLARHPMPIGRAFAKTVCGAIALGLAPGSSGNRKTYEMAPR